MPSSLEITPLADDLEIPMEAFLVVLTGRRAGYSVGDARHPIDVVAIEPGALLANEVGIGQT